MARDLWLTADLSVQNNIMNTERTFTNVDDAVLVKLPIGQMQIERAGVRTIFDVPGFPVIVK